MDNIFDWCRDYSNFNPSRTHFNPPHTQILTLPHTHFNPFTSGERLRRCGVGVHKLGPGSRDVVTIQSRPQLGDHLQTLQGGVQVARVAEILYPCRQGQLKKG